jgi:uncharacterized membrane protein (DUF106 family)
MFAFYTNFILPLIKALFIPCDWLIGWMTYLGPLGALIAIGALTGVLVNLFQKYCSNQKLLGARKSDIETLKTLLKEAKQSGDKDKAARVRGLTGRISSKYAMESMKPALWSIPPMCVVAMWAGERMAYLPLHPGDEVELVAHFEDGASGFSHIVPAEGLVMASPAIAPIEIPKKAQVAAAVPTVGAVKKEGKEETPANVAQAETSAPKNSVAVAAVETAEVAGPQAHWRIRVEKDGTFPLRVRHGEDQYELSVPVYKSGGHPPEKASVYRLESPSKDKLLALEFKLKDSVPEAWWNLTFRWMGIYLLAAVAFGVGLRRVMGIQ